MSKRRLVITAVLAGQSQSEVARAYGVFNDTVGAAMRGTFIIDKAGVVVDAFQTETLGQAREKALYDSALAKLA